MPRPEQVIPRAAADAPHGATSALQRLALARPMPGSAPEEAGPVPTEDPTVPPEIAGDLNDGLDEYLFAPTERPNEPLTAGAPFGQGANFVPRPYETPRAFKLRVADTLSSSPGAGPEVQRLIERIRRGE